MYKLSHETEVDKTKQIIEIDITRNKHDKYAPYWALGLLLLLLAGLSSTWFYFGAFWNGYALDSAGPAWNYILFRGLFTARADNRWSRFFTPVRTCFIFIGVCIGIELAQYFKLYDATFDPFDFVAYVSLLVPLFIVDLWQSGGLLKPPKKSTFVKKTKS